MAPYETAAISPEGYAFSGQPEVSETLLHILTRIDRVDFKFTGVLNPMTLADFDTLIRKQGAKSSPGCSGITYGHLRAMGTKARQACSLVGLSLGDLRSFGPLSCTYVISESFSGPHSELPVTSYSLVHRDWHCRPARAPFHAPHHTSRRQSRRPRRGLNRPA